MSFEKAKDLDSYLSEHNNIVIISHVGGDGDSIGSTTALRGIIKRVYNKDAIICLPNEVPRYLEHTPTIDSIINFKDNEIEVREKLTKADLFLFLDLNTYDRMGEIGEILKESNVTKVMIDHHIDPISLNLNICNIGTSSTCEIILNITENISEIKGIPFSEIVDLDCAYSLYLGMMTDTGSFRYPSTSDNTFLSISKLLAIGLEHSKIHENLFSNDSINKVKLHGYAISQKMKILNDTETAVVTLTREDLKQFDYENGDAEGIVNKALSLRGITRSIILREDLEVDNLVKMSFRSIGEDNPVNILATEYFNGGGHKNASGGRCTSIEEGVNKLKEYFEK